MFRPEIKSRMDEDISILVKLDNHPWNYICECGDASDLTLKEVQQSNAIFISHTHIDHFENFDAVIRHQIGIERRIVICGPKGIQEHVQARLKSYTWNLIEQGAIVYEIREVVSDSEIQVYQIEPPLWPLVELEPRQGNVIFEEETFSVIAILLDHKTPTLAYKFQEEETVKIDLASSGFKGGRWVKELKDAYSKNLEEVVLEIEGKEHRAGDLFHLLHVQEGDSVGIVMDHAAHFENHAKIKEHFFRCRRVFIESFYMAEDKDLADKNYHSYSSKSGEIMKLAEVAEPIPVHFSRKYKEEDISDLVSEFEAALL